MYLRDLTSRITAGLDSVGSLERDLIRVLAVAVTALNASLYIADLVQEQQLYKLLSEYDWVWSVAYNPTVQHFHLRILAALLFSTIFIWSLKARRLIISLLALQIVGIEYLKWYLDSVSTKENAGIERLPEPSAAGFYGASNWDVVSLVIAALLFIWHLKILIQALRTPASGRGNNAISGAPEINTT